MPPHRSGSPAGAGFISWWRRLSGVAAVVVVALGLSSCGGQPAARGRSTASSPVLSAASDPPLAAAAGIYAHDGVGMFAPAAAHVPYLIYVPESAGNGVDVIDPATMRVRAHYTTGLDPQHVVPAWDLKTLYSTNDLANTSTPFDPHTGAPAGPAIPVDDPYNMYFTPDGRHAIVVAEARQHLDFRDPHTFALQKRVPVTCSGVDHGDFSADGSYMILSCEFAARLVKIDLRTETVAGYLNLHGASPQDVKLSPDGKIFYVADMYLGGVHLIDAPTFTQVGFIKTGRDAHGLYPSRDGRLLYVSNRGAGSVTVIDFATRKVVTTWHLTGGGSPDMGGVSPDGKTLWLSGRYNAAVYAIDTTNGHLLATIHVTNKPHGLCVWPQPGRYSTGHTGDMR